MRRFHKPNAEAAPPAAAFSEDAKRLELEAEQTEQGLLHDWACRRWPGRRWDDGSAMPACAVQGNVVVLLGTPGVDPAAAAAAVSEAVEAALA